MTHLVELEMCFNRMDRGVWDLPREGRREEQCWVRRVALLVTQLKVNADLFKQHLRSRRVSRGAPPLRLGGQH
jgi:hypothetical protein